MGHLSTETLARLVSEAPTPGEAEHLASCSLCRSELEDLKVQTDALGRLPDLRPPEGDWEALEGRLVSEGLIHEGNGAAGPSRWWASGWLQAAAGLVLFLTGAALGPRIASPSFFDDEPAQGAPGDVSLVPVEAGSPPPTTLPEAAEAVRMAERQYIDALVRYRQLVDSQGNPSLVGDPASRFAAIESLVAAGRAALQEAPTDPFVNGVLVSALAERESILRNASLSGDGVF